MEKRPSTNDLVSLAVGGLTTPEWPSQRLRLGWGLVLFYVFERLVGRTLPDVVPYLALGLGIGALASAFISIRALRAATLGALDEPEEE